MAKTKQQDVPVGTIAHELHNTLIARHGLRAAVIIARELQRSVEATLREQVRRHPAEWPEYATVPPCPL